MTGTVPSPGDALHPRGRALWDSVLTAYELDPAESDLLLEVCRLVDHLERVHTAVLAEPLTSPGSTGQPVASPLLAELRAGRRQLVELVATLHIPVAAVVGVVARGVA